GSQTGVRGPPGGREGFPGSAGPRTKKNILRHNLLTSSIGALNLKHDFQTTFETFYTLIFQKRGLRRFRRVSRTRPQKIVYFLKVF
ncbi:hypothetical protein WDU94_005002, partial [Cyamophila willieti]